jgi:hypothetical protein
MNPATRQGKRHLWWWPLHEVRRICTGMTLASRRKGLGHLAVGVYHSGRVLLSSQPLLLDILSHCHYTAIPMVDCNPMPSSVGNQETVQ